MERHRSNPPALEAFWQQADEDASGEHPLEREIADRVDALLRYHMLIADAQAEGRDDLVAILQAQEERQERLLRELREALQRMRPHPE